MNEKPKNAKVTIAVVPRERFSLMETAIEHIYAFTQEPFDLIVIDPKSPPFVGEKLKKWEKRNPNCRVIRSERFLYPYEAKNLAVKHLSPETEWVVFVDSDVKVSPHWLSWFLKAAEETGARVLHPLYLIEQKKDTAIHMADGEMKEFKRNGNIIVQPVMNYVGMNICNSANFVRQKSGFLEFHTFMVHREILKEMGDFQPFTLAEDVNFSLRLREKNEKIIFEPRSVVTYVAGPPFESYDLPYFKFRWDPKVGADSVNRLSRRWPIKEAYWAGKLEWARFHRSRVSPWFVPLSFGNRLLSKFRAVGSKLKNRAARLGFAARPKEEGNNA